MKPSQTPELPRRLSGWLIFVPTVKTSDNSNPLRLGRPDGEIDPRCAVANRTMSAELEIKPAVQALIESSDIFVREEVLNFPELFCGRLGGASPSN